MGRRREDLDRLTELEELFADLWQVPRFAAGLRRAHRPQIDCFRTTDPDELMVVVEIPGADPSQIQIVVDGRRLLVAGERPRPDPRGAQFHRSEIEYGPFQRDIVLHEDIDVAGGRADYELGLLRIVFPLAARAPVPQKVTIDVRRSG
jgi:HSP20 family protein